MFGVFSHLFSETNNAELPSPTEVLPVQSQWLDETDYTSPDPACYDRLLEKDDDSPDDLNAEEA